MDSFAELGAALTERISELRKLALLRIEDGGKELFQQDLAGLEVSVRALETQVATLKSCIQGELAAVPKVEALIDASKVQSDRLNAIAANLPARLPRPVVTSVQGASLASCRAGGQHDPTQQGPTGTAPTAADEGARRRKDVPRWYVTEREFEATSAYLRGRLQPDKVNAALDELASHALNNQKLMAAMKAGGSKLAPADRKRATELLHNATAKDVIKGHYWFLDSDLREGSLVKPDKSGKAMLTLLRHLGRLQEVRCNIDGASTYIYVLVERTV
ncbi:hypothetical protein Agub_g14430 [Astrephomene gubernaculifera]|uniref:Spindle and kinetochore-associated protein 1 n=1 Tax=Astrephomene gubernaculifera TaxID=47775 RepID=A0AAD3E378_9CHLO|nr:hypothetical protein Agub_g14430 [Astrephomene gubernaculifera]